MKIHELDNVEVLLRSEGNVPAGHKIALCDIAEGDPVIKYGSPIGHATRAIHAGEWVHSHNMATNLESLGTQPTRSSLNSLIGSAACVAQADQEPSTLNALNPQETNKTFMGYERPNGRVGIRNELWVLPTVGCVADLAQRLAREMQSRTKLTVRAFPHNFGCSQLGDDHADTRQILASLAMHPNAGGVLLLGLGCENNQLSELLPLIECTDRLRSMESQKVGDEMAVGIRLLSELAAKAEQDERTPQSVAKLCIGLKCGGSDGFSGITANPLLGKLTDLLTVQGATAILTEVPEMFGAEHVLLGRCKDLDTQNKANALIRDFKQYYLDHGQPVGENPSPGNKEGGITTLEEKSLGCVQKGGSATITGVLSYGQRVTSTGLNMLCAPGNDLVASTALAAAGCQMVLFTTGRGTPFGTCVPTLKISTNTPLYQQKPHWIDLDAGIILEGYDPLLQLLDLVIEVASGKPSRNEENGYSSISIWKNGVTL